MSDLTGKIAFVANASSAAGQACVAKLKSAGAKVCGVDSDAADLGVSVNPMTPESWDEAFQHCIEKLGGLDVVVIETAGEASGSIEDISLADFKAAHRGMVIPAFLAQNRGVIAMRSAGRAGAIVHITPAAARAAMEHAVATCTASAGILFSSKSAALECAKAKDGIVVNTILVGPVEGESALPYDEDVSVIPPHAVADAVLFYATDGAVYMSGMDLPLDGGFLAQ
jgi:NAD(P)-dependent dehydrogenase (short-subunit alcohol dehydrogenase family)